MSKTTNRFSSEVRARAVRLVREHEADHSSRWAALVSVAGKIGCSAQTLNGWANKAEIDGGGARPPWAMMVWRLLTTVARLMGAGRSARDYPEFRVWAGIKGGKEPRSAETQRA